MRREKLFIRATLPIKFIHSKFFVSYCVIDFAVGVYYKMSRIHLLTVMGYEIKYYMRFVVIRNDKYNMFPCYYQLIIVNENYFKSRL